MDVRGRCAGTVRLTTTGRTCKLAAQRAPPPRHFLPVNSKPPPASPEQTAPSDFERSLAELETIVEKLEQGDLSLDESLRHFERGVQLTRVCQSALKQAEQKVEILLRKSGAPEQFEAAPFDAEDNERDS
jgi:exodeoxyribonuclease VII small subunit